MSDDVKPAAAAPKPAEKATTSSSSDASSGASTSASTTTSTSSGSGGEAGKSSRESIGGAKAVHYGYFSNIKTPEYKSGWDSIWGNKKSAFADNPDQAAAQTPKARTGRGKVPKAKEPVLISLSVEDLPGDVQRQLVEMARVQLKKSRVNYDSRDKAGAVSWRIECEVRR